MKSLKPIMYLAGVAAAVATVEANNGLEAYRLGHYDKAASLLWTESGKKDPVTEYYLGRMQLNGYGLLKNNPQALMHIELSAKQGHSPAQWFMGRYELTVKNDPERAYNWFNKLAAKGDRQAQLYVIAARQYGYGVSKLPERARSYYIEAAKDGDQIAQYVLGKDFLHSRHWRTRKLGLIWMQKSADQNYARAQTYLGQVYLEGKKVKKDKAKTIELWTSAAENNYIPAMIKLGRLAKQQDEYRVAKLWFEKGAEAENPTAMLELAGLFQDKESPVYDPNAAFMWTLKAAQTDSPTAQKALAKLYKEGLGVMADPEKAKQWEEKADKTASQNKETRARDRLLSLLTNNKAKSFVQTPYYLEGILTTWENPSALVQTRYNAAPAMQGIKSAEIFKPQFTVVTPQDVAFNEYFDLLAPMLSANGKREWRFPRYPLDEQIQILMDNESLVLPHSQWKSMVNEGRPYPESPADSWNYLDENTKGWQQRANLYAVVMRLYNQAILGNPEAQFEIGQLYHYGVGLAKNPEQAKLYYELAAEQNDVRAEYNLGILYMEGLLPEPDYEKGMAWLTDAAFRGNAYAQYVLANIYQYGFNDPSGMPVIAPDHHKATNMYYLAAANHFGPAQYKLANFLISQHDKGLSVAARKNRMKVVKNLYRGAVQQGVADAYLPYAFYQAMQSDPAQQKEAFEIAKAEAEKGTPQAALLLGLMYDRGISVQPDNIQALYWYQQAAYSPVKSFILGTYYSQGHGMAKDLSKGRQLLQNAADAGFSYADLNLAVLNQQAGQPFIFELIKAKNEGNTRAALLLADYYLAQDSDEDKLAQARDIYLTLAEKGEADAQLKAGYLYSEGMGGLVDLNKAASWFAKAAEQGQPMAQFLLAQMYQLGQIGKGPDLQLAKKWYAAAQQRMPRAAVALGFVYDTAEDNYGQAMTSYQLAANKHNQLGQYNLGLLYENGKGMAVDMRKAREFYTLAAQQNQPQAMTRLAIMNFNGQGGDKNEAAAWDWFTKAANMGDRTALYQLGLLSETGIGQRIDFAQAIDYYQKAAALGDEQASLALARIYQYGLGGSSNPEKAREIYTKLAQRDNAFAQYQLALLTLQSTMDETSLKDVKKLLTQAGDNGNVQAQHLLHKMDALAKNGPSFIEPIGLNKAPLVKGEPAERLYWDALNEWNRGDAVLSKMMLERLLEEYPQYAPAKRAYEQLSRPQKALKLG